MCETKICSKCGNEKLLVEFSKRKDSKDGYNNQCKLCLSEKRKEWWGNNQEKSENYRKEFRKKNPEHAKNWQKKLACD